MNEIASRFLANFQRHFIVWGLIAATIMFCGKIDQRESFDKPEPQGTLTDVLTKFECKDTVEGKFPTAVVLYNIKTGGHVVSKNPDRIGKALDEALGGKDWKGYTPKYFCK